METGNPKLSVIAKSATSVGSLLRIYESRFNVCVGMHYNTTKSFLKISQRWLHKLVKTDVYVIPSIFPFFKFEPDFYNIENSSPFYDIYIYKYD